MKRILCEFRVDADRGSVCSWRRTLAGSHARCRRRRSEGGNHRLWFDGIQELLRSKGITAIPTVNCVFDDGPGDDDFFCEPGLHGERHNAHGAHVAEALLSIAPNVDLY